MVTKLKLSNLLALLSIAIGLPGFIVALALPDYSGIGILALIIAFLLFVFWRIITSPLWTITELRSTIQIKKPDGSLATATKITKMKANHKGLTEFAHRNIRADGNIRNFKLHSARVPQRDIEIKAGEYIVHERFDKPTGLWQSRVSHLVYTLVKSYPANTEFTGYVPDYLTKKAIIEVHFPPARPARKPRAYCSTGAETEQLDSPELSADGLTISWEGKGLTPGKDYTIEWDW